MWIKLYTPVRYETTEFQGDVAYPVTGYSYLVEKEAYDVIEYDKYSFDIIVTQIKIGE